MPADQSNIGMGRRRQGDTEPDRGDDRNRSLDRVIDGEPDADAEYERGKTAGAKGAGRPHDSVKPGTQRAIEESDAGQA